MPPTLEVARHGRDRYRVSVAFTADELVWLRAIAKMLGVSLDHLSREAVAAAYLRPAPAERAAAVERMAELSLPVVDLEQMEREAIISAGIQWHDPVQGSPS